MELCVLWTGVTPPVTKDGMEDVSMDSTEWLEKLERLMELQ